MRAEHCTIVGVKSLTYCTRGGSSLSFQGLIYGLVGGGCVRPSWGRKPKGDLSRALQGRSDVFSFGTSCSLRKPPCAGRLWACGWVWMDVPELRLVLEPNVSRGWARLRGRGLIPVFPGWCRSPQPRQHPEAPTALLLAGTRGAQRGIEAGGHSTSRNENLGCSEPPPAAPGCPAPW